MSVLQNAEPQLILASGSAARQRLLAAAGLRFAVETQPVDEEMARETLAAQGVAGEDAAVAIAELKAQRVAANNPGAVVVGGDQLLETAEGLWLEKPRTRDGLRTQVTALAGKTHTLHTAAVAFRGGSRIWHRVESPKIAVRSLTPTLIDAYLATVDDGVLDCVGGYRLEGLGVHLMARVDGDGFAVQGLPLLALLQCLRAQGVLVG